MIYRILYDIGFQNANHKNKPAKIGKLPYDERGPGPQAIWSYYLVILRLIYLVVNYCSDISIDVHQCALYSHNPLRRNEVEVKIILHYLNGTKDDRPRKTGYRELIVDTTYYLVLDSFVEKNVYG